MGSCTAANQGKARIALCMAAVVAMVFCVAILWLPLLSTSLFLTAQLELL
jgi:hypothetical protein